MFFLAVVSFLFVVPCLLAQLPTELGSALPPITDGQVNAIVVSGDTAYVGGQFSLMGEQTGGARFFDATTLLAQDGWPYINGAVLCAIPDGNGGFYVGGKFDRVGGLVRSRVAHIKADKTVDAAFDVNVGAEVDNLDESPGDDESGGEQTRAMSEVDSLLLQGNTLYVGGYFKRVNGWAERWSLAAVDPGTGIALAFDPFISKCGYDGVYVEYADHPGQVFCMEVIGSTLYVGGDFLSVGRQSNPATGYEGQGQTARINLAAYDLNSGALLAWNPNSGQTVGMPVNHLKAFGTAELIVSGPSVYHPDGQGGGYYSWPLAGANLAYGLAKLDAQTAELSNWNPAAPYGATTITGLVLVGNNLYLAGTRYVAGTQTLWEVNAVTGNLQTFNPGTNAPTAIGAINNNTTLLVGGTVYYGTPTAESYPYGTPHGFAAVDMVSGSLSQIQPSEDFHANGDNSYDYSSQYRQTMSVIATSGNIVLAGGNIRSFAPKYRNNLAAFSVSTGKLLSWQPSVGQAYYYGYPPHPEVYTMLLQGSTLYVGGSFTQANSETCSNLAAFDAGTGATTGWAPLADGTVRSIAALGSQIYLAGDFDTVGGQSRIGLAAVDAATATVLSWNPSPNGVARAIITDGSLIYAGGYFTSVGSGVTRRGLAAFDISGNVAPFNANLNANSSNGVLSLALYGSTLYVGGEFSGANSANANVTRNFAAAFDTGTSAVTNWNPDLNGSVSALVVNNGIAYVGGRFSSVNVTVGQQPITCFAATRASDGLLLHTSSLFRNADFGGNAYNYTNTSPAPTAAVTSLAIANGTLFVGGIESSLPSPSATYTPNPFYYIYPLDFTFNIDPTQVGSSLAALELPLTAPGTAAPAFPVITSLPALTLGMGKPYSFQIAATNGATSFSINDLPLGLTLNPDTGLISGTPMDGSTVPILRYIIGAKSSSGTTYQAITLNIVPLPVIDSTLTASGQVGTAFDYFADATNSPTSYGASGLPTGLSINVTTGEISGNPTVSGTFTVTLSATNAGGTTTATLTLTVAAAPLQPPVITSSTTLAGQVGTSFTYQVAATNSPTGFAASGLPDGVSINASTGAISGTPMAAGTFYPYLTATNAAGSGSSYVTFTVSATPVTAPAITSALSASAQVGQWFTYQITATNSPSGYSAVGLPTGLSINATTGLISGTPTAAGSFPVSLSAQNAGGSGPATLTITVAAAPTQPSFFAGETALSNGVYYLQFPSGNYFGYFSYLTDPHYIYHFDLGYEYWFDAADGNDGVYFYDFKSNGFFYTSPTFPFPYLYDFTLNTVLYYYPDPNIPGRYNTNGVRYFYDFANEQIITK